MLRWIVVGTAFAAACSGRGSSATDPPTAGSGAAQVDQELAKIIASCSEASHTVETRRKGQPQWDPIGVGATFRERDWVRTGAGSFARIRFFDRGFVDLRENTTIIIDSAISVEQGALVGLANAGADPLVVKAGDGTLARIATPAGEEPAEFRITPSSDKSLEIAITKGRAKVTTTAGERVLAAGQATDLASEHASDVVTLLGFPRSVSPGVDARFHYVSGQAITLTWAPLPDATRYLVQVSRDTEFRAFVVNSAVDATSSTFVPDEAGSYAWRVAAYDAHGRLGEFGFARRIFVELETPRDLLIAPRDGAKFGFSDSYPRIAFSWQSVGEVTHYRLVVRLANAAATAGPVLDLPTDQQHAELGMLGEGDYRWSVYAVRGDEELPIFLAPRQLTIRKQRIKANTEGLWK